MDLRILFVDDSPDDVRLMLHHLSGAGLEPQWSQVQSESELREALAAGEWQVALVDYNLPGFGGPAALRLLAELAPDTLTITVSGAIDEETAVATLRAGAVDYVLKSNLARLVPAVEHAVADVELRRERRLAEAALREGERVLGTLMGNLPGMAYRCANDPQWTMEFMSAGCEELTGYPPEALIGNARLAFADLIPPRH